MSIFIFSKINEVATKSQSRVRSPSYSKSGRTRFVHAERRQQSLRRNLLEGFRYVRENHTKALELNLVLCSTGVIYFVYF